MLKLVTVAIFLASVLHSLVRADQVIAWLRTNQNEMWIGLGRPMGYFTSVSEGRFFTAIIAREQLVFTLMWKTPELLRGHSRVRHLINQMRITGIVAFACVVILACYF